MTFVNLLALFLGLLGLIALLIIYILKPKYEDKTVASTYVWKLSLKYQRPKSPFDWLKSSLLLILQILIIVTIALLMGGPLLKSKTFSGEKIVVLDGSVSMQTLENGESRFNKAKKEIIKLVNSTTPDHRFTLIYLGNDTNYVVRRSNSAEYIRQHIDALVPTELSNNVDSANALVESVLRENPEAKIYIYSSKNVRASSKVEVINYKNSKSWNAGIVGFRGNLQPNGYYQFQVELMNYGLAKDVALVLNIDGRYVKSQTISLAENDEQLISFPDIQVLNYSNAEVFLDINDDYHYDNSYTIYNKKSNRIDVQIYSEGDKPSTTFFLQSALSAISTSVYVDVVAKEEDLKDRGYDLYIYESYEPNVIPSDGSVWYFNPESLSGLTILGEQSGNFYLAPNASSSTLYEQLLGNVDVSTILVTKYQQITSYAGYDSLARIGSDPLLLTRTIGDQKIFVIPFDFAYSNLPLLIDYPYLIYNLFNYSTVKVISDNDFEVGTQVSIEAKISARAVSVISDEETITYTSFPITYKLNSLGSYQIMQSFDDKPSESEYIYVHVATSESWREIDGGEFIIPHVSATANDDNFNYVNLLPYILLALFAFILIEWVVQYREQY